MKKYRTACCCSIIIVLSKAGLTPTSFSCNFKITKFKRYNKIFGVVLKLMHTLLIPVVRWSYNPILTHLPLGVLTMFNILINLIMLESWRPHCHHQRGSRKSGERCWNCGGLCRLFKMTNNLSYLFFQPGLCPLFLVYILFLKQISVHTTVAAAKSWVYSSSISLYWEVIVGIFQ